MKTSLFIRITALLLVLALSIGLVTGCSGSTESVSSSAASEPEDQEEKIAEGSSSEAEDAEAAEETPSVAEIARIGVNSTENVPAQSNIQKLGTDSKALDPVVDYGDQYLSICGERAPYDKESDIWYVPQDCEEEEWDGKLVWSDGSELTFVKDDLLDDRAATLSEGHVFTMNVKGLGSIRVVFTGMPAIVLTTASSEDVSGEKYSEIYSGNLKMIDPTGYSRNSAEKDEITNYSVVTSDATWHLRGATSMAFEKPCWRIELHDELGENRKVAMLDMRDDDDWILLSLYNDDSKIRDKMSLDVWNELASGNDWDPEGVHIRYVEVFRDDCYEGLYGLMEPLDQKSMDLNTETDYLYKTTDWYCPTNSEMFELRAQTGRSFNLEYPKEYSSGSQWQPLRDYIDMFYNSAGATSAAVMEAHVNLNNNIDYYLFINGCCAIDNSFKNAYIWAHKEDMGISSMYVYYKIPWDLNYTWGEYWIDTTVEQPEELDARNYTYFNWETVDWDLRPGDISTLLNSDFATVGPMVGNRWRELRETIFSEEHIKDRMQALRDYLTASGAFTRDSERWPGSANDPDLTDMFEHLEQRYENLDKLFASYK